MTKRRKKALDAVRRADFPALCDFLDGYLHQDFLDVHGSVPGAARAFVKDANASERSGVVRELRAFIKATDGLPAERVGDLITHELGGAWVPRAPQDIEALLAALTTPA